MDILQALRQNAAKRAEARALDAERDQLIVRAREEGCPWEQIVQASQMSRAGVTNAFNRSKHTA